MASQRLDNSSQKRGKMGEINKTNSYTEFFYKAFHNVLLVSLPLLVISAFILSIPHSSANNSDSDNLAITISSSCTLSSVVNIPHNAEVYNGNHLGDIGKTTIKTLCNDGNGYSVYAVGYSNNEEGNNKLINSERPEYSIDTGLNTSGLTSQWAMKLNNIPDDPSPTPPTIESDYNNTYGIVPPYWTKVASRASGTTDMAQGSSFTTTYAVYASSSQYAGTYQGQVKYLLVHPAYQQPPMRYMQDVADWKDQLSMEESVQAIDARDGKKYWVAKLKDGHIWMTQNLDLDLDNMKTYTYYDTDLGWTVSSTSATWKPSSSTISFTGATVPGWQSSETIPQSADPGDIYYYTSNSGANDAQYNSLQDCTNAGHTESDCKHYHAGNYYNWSATMAGSTKSGNEMTGSICPAGWRLPSIYNEEFGSLLLNYNVISSADSTTYTPSGFRIVRNSPLYFVRAGTIGWNINQLVNTGTNASYMSSTVTNYPLASFDFGLASVGPNGYNQYPAAKRIGYTVRCMAR